MSGGTHSQNLVGFNLECHDTSESNTSLSSSKISMDEMIQSSIVI